MRIVKIKDNEYPKQLAEIDNPPKILYCEGNIKLLEEKTIAIIGSRCCSDYGVEMAKEFSKQLTQEGFCIVSGMAKGIDSVAHSACLEEKGNTIAVLGCGFNKIFPKENIPLYKKIIYNNGLVISEYEPDTEANTKNFPARNRIVSGLSMGVLVIESAYRSGTSITAGLARKQNKKVFCIPHNLKSKTGTGNNRLIKEGAKIVISIEDILNEYNMLENKKIEEEEKNINIPIEYKEIYELLTYELMPINYICKKLNYKISEVNYLITMMEMENLIEVKPGNFVKRK